MASDRSNISGYVQYGCRAGHTALHDDGKCHAAVFGEECGLDLRLMHNHITRDIKPQGQCAACDKTEHSDDGVADAEG